MARKPWMVWMGLAFAVSTWASTFLLSVPAHNRLSGGFDVEVHRSLVLTNGLRVLGWSGHSAILLLMTARALR